MDDTNVSKPAQNPLELLSDSVTTDMLDEDVFDGSEADNEDEIVSNAEKNVLNDFSDAKDNPKEDVKPKVEDFTPENWKILQKQIEEQQKSIKLLSTSLDDLNMQIKDLIAKEKSRKENLANFVEKITAGCTQLEEARTRLIDLQNTYCDTTANLIGDYFQSNYGRLQALCTSTADRCEKINSDCEKAIKQTLDIGVKNLNASLAGQKKFVKTMNLKFSFATFALIFSGVITPLLILYFIAILRRWI